MLINAEKYRELQQELTMHNAMLVAVSKTKTVEAINELYALGHRDFGENYVQELVDKQAQLPPDIRWHFIGHLQTNKVKYIAPFVHLIHGIDSLKLLKEVDKQAARHNRVIEVLLQVHISEEETKFGLDEQELQMILHGDELAKLKNICISGFMGMASFSTNEALVRSEFKALKKLFEQYRRLPIANFQPHILSMGMSADYRIALEEGSTMVRIGSLLFGSR